MLRLAASRHSDVADRFRHQARKPAFHSEELRWKHCVFETKKAVSSYKRARKAGRIIAVRASRAGIFVTSSHGTGNGCPRLEKAI